MGMIGFLRNVMANSPGKVKAAVSQRFAAVQISRRRICGGFSTSLSWIPPRFASLVPTTVIITHFVDEANTQDCLVSARRKRLGSLIK